MQDIPVMQVTNHFLKQKIELGKLKHLDQLIFKENLQNFPLHMKKKL